MKKGIDRLQLIRSLGSPATSRGATSTLDVMGSHLAAFLRRVPSRGRHFLAFHGDPAFHKRKEGRRRLRHPSAVGRPSPGRYLSDSAATPGRFLPSSSSSEAPPPVEQWLTLSTILFFLAAVAVSPPPMMVMAPALVASTMA